MYGYIVKTVLSKYSKVGSHMKQNRMQIPIDPIFTSVYTIQKLWIKKSVFNKNIQNSHIKLVSTKDTAYILTNSKIGSVNLVEIYNGKI